MNKCCGECKHWKNQNKRGKFPLRAIVEEQEVGACWKLQRAIVDTNGQDKIFQTEKGITNILFHWIEIPIYTVESFCCNMFTENNKPKIERGK